MIPAAIASILVLLAATAATRLARPVHAALALALALALAGILQIILGAAFIGLVQFMVYVGAVAILILFSLLVTRPDDEPAERESRRTSWPVILLAALPAGAAIAATIPGFAGQTGSAPTPPAPALPLADLGKLLYTTHAPAVILLGVLLTGVLLGATLIALNPGTPASRSDS